VAASATALAEWDDFVEREPEAAKAAFERLSENPLERRPGRQFPLRGRPLRPFWEFEATGADRIWYAIDLTVLTVIVACRRNVHTGAKVAAIIKSRRAAFDEMPTPKSEPTQVLARLRKPKSEGG
jgi:hypothetical protein